MAGTMPEEQLALEANPAVAFRIQDNLWIGSAPPIGRTVGKYFKCLVLSAAEYQPKDCFPGVEIVSVGLNDDGSPMTVNEMRLAVRAAGKVINWLQRGKATLVTCHMGLNRSGLICALVLCRGPAKMSPQEAVGTIRNARGSNALRNRYFLDFLLSYCGDSVRKT